MKTIEELQRDNSLEIVALLLTCRVFFKTAGADELCEFIGNNGIDWTLFYNMVYAHRIRPVVNKVFSEIKTETPISDRLQAESRQIAIRNFEHYRELLLLNNLFKQKSITAVPYKGCLFSLQFYNDLSLREFSDLDFLIDPGVNEVAAIKKVMETGSYTPGFEVQEAFEEFYFGHTREFKFVQYINGRRNFLAEFHTSLNEGVFEASRPVPNAFLFEDAEQRIFIGSKIKTLSREKHFIAILSHHGIREQWTSLKNIVDLAQVIKSGDMEWGIILGSSRKYRFKKTLDIGFSIADDLLGIHPPVTFKKVNAEAWRERLLSKHLFPTDRTWKYNLGLKFRSKDDLADKVRMVFNHARHIATPSVLDYEFVQLPKGLYFLYVFVKPVRMWKRR